VATWDILRKCLHELFEADDFGNDNIEIPLSNVKRALRCRYKVDLSETALGYATASELFKDERLLDICSLRLDKKGYILVPSPFEERKASIDKGTAFDTSPLADLSSASPSALCDESNQILSAASVPKLPVYGVDYQDDAWVSNNFRNGSVAGAHAMSDQSFYGMHNACGVVLVQQPLAPIDGRSASHASPVLGEWFKPGLDFTGNSNSMMLPMPGLAPAFDNWDRAFEANDASESQIFVSTPSPLLSGGGFALRIFEEVQSIGTASGTSAETKNDESLSFHGTWINRDGNDQEIPHYSFQATGATTCKVVTKNKTFTGVLQSDDTILWNDGDVWRRGTAEKSTEPTSLDCSADADSLPMSPREIFASTPDSFLSGGDFESRIQEEVSQEEVQFVGTAAGTAALAHAEADDADISDVSLQFLKGCGARAPAETENEDISNLPLQFIEGGGFALQSGQDSVVTVDEPEPEPVRWTGSIAGGDTNGAMLFVQPLVPGQAFDGTVAKVVNTFITVLPCAQHTYSASGRCRAQSEGLARPSA